MGNRRPSLPKMLAKILAKFLAKFLAKTVWPRPCGQDPVAKILANTCERHIRHALPTHT